MNPVCNDDGHLNRNIDVYLAFVAFRLRAGSLGRSLGMWEERRNIEAGESAYNF